MADGIRKPWLLNYLISYAEQYGGQLGTSQPKRGKVQIINFRTLPESPDEWVWADVSDKRHAATVRFTMESVQAFNDDPRNAGRRLTSRRWGVATIRCVRPLWCRRPTEAGKGLEDKWTLALEVDQVEVAASEGEAMFGEPRCVTMEVPMSRWIEGIGDGSHGAGGNVLRLERLERERREKELNLATKKDKDSTAYLQSRHAIANPEAHASGGNERPSIPQGRQRLRDWKLMVKEIGLLQAYKCHKIPDDQMQLLNEITVFGLDSSANDTSQAKIQKTERQLIYESVADSPDGSTGIEVPRISQSLRSPLRKAVSERPTTPSQWDATQRTDPDENQDRIELAVVSMDGSPIQQVDLQRKDEGGDFEYQIEEPNVQGSISLGQQQSINHKMDDAGDAEIEVTQIDNEDEMEVIRADNKDDVEVDESIGVPWQPESRSPKPFTTAPTPSMMAVPPKVAPAAPLLANEPVILAPNSDISCSQSQPQAQSQPQSQSLTQPSPSQPPSNENKFPKAEFSKTSPHDPIPEYSSPQRRQGTPHAQCGVEFRQDARKALLMTEIGVAPASNQSPPSGTSHNTDSRRSSSKHGGLVKPSRRHISPAEALAEKRPQKRRKLLKLGGWLPRKDVANGPQIMTWESFNRMLLEIYVSKTMNPFSLESQSSVQDPPALVKTPSQAEKKDYDPLKQTKLRQDNRYEKEGKRWVRRRENSRFAANPHVVKPTANDFGVHPSLPRATFPKPLPPFLPRHLSAPSASPPSRDPASSNAGRYSLSLKGVRRDLRRSGPRSEEIILDMEKELTQWLHSAGIILSPDQEHSPTDISGTPLGMSNSILEISRSPMELVWRIDEDFPRFLLHCVARFHGVVSFSKAAPEGGIRLTHLLRPNVTRPDFMAAGALDTPPASDIDTFSVFVDTEDSDAASEQGNALNSEAGDTRRPLLSVVREEHVHQDTSPHGEADSVLETQSSVGENDEDLSWSVDSLPLAPQGYDWEQNPMRRGSRGTSSSSQSPTRTFHRPRRVPGAKPLRDRRQLGFWYYVFA